MYTNYQSQFWAHALTLNSASDIDQQREALIDKIESQLRMSEVAETLFTLRWKLV